MGMDVSVSRHYLLGERGLAEAMEAKEGMYTSKETKGLMR